MVFFILDSRLGTGSVDRPSVLMEGVGGQHERNKDKEDNKGWFAILLLQLPQPYAATFGATLHNSILRIYPGEELSHPCHNI